MFTGLSLHQPAMTWLRFTFAYVMLNVPHWLLGHWFYISRPLLNVELVVPLLLAPLSWLLSLTALLGTWALDIAVSQSRSYHFTSPLEFVRSVGFLTSLNLVDFITLPRLALACPFAVCASLAYWLTPKHAIPWAAALSVVVALTAADISNGSSMLSKNAIRWVSVNIAGSPSTTLLVRAWEERNPRPLNATSGGTSAVAQANLDSWVKSHPDRSVLLVIVESMGLHKNFKMRAWLQSQFSETNASSRYVATEAIVPSSGSTTWAELRELCELSGSYRNLTAAVAKTCLPNRLVAAGWRSVGFHGFSGNMFHRSSWWQVAGIQETHFAEDLLAVGETTCGGAYGGVCDAAIIERALSEARAKRRFVYALTLNSHLPLAKIAIPADLQAICDELKVGEDVCLLTATIGKGLAPLKRELHTHLSAEIILVGDHAPPFLKLEDRAQYDQNHVPAFIFTPRE